MAGALDSDVTDGIGAILERAKEVAIDYYEATGKPLGVTGEVGEYEAARLLGLRLSEVRTAGYDATGKGGFQYQIKARSLSPKGRRKSQRIGTINLDHEFDAVLLVVMDERLETTEIWEAERAAVEEALRAPGSKARNERGALSISAFKRIGRNVYRSGS